MRRNKILSIDKKDIEQYLSKVKEAVKNDKYRIERNARSMLKDCFVIVISFHEQKHPLTFYFK